jgi:zinc-ribbon domain
MRLGDLLRKCAYEAGWVAGAVYRAVCCDKSDPGHNHKIERKATMYCSSCGVEIADEYAFCPKCGHPRGGVKKNGNSPSKGLVAASYGFAIGIPFIGFIMGIYLMYKEKKAHGLAVIILSIVMFSFWLQLFS